MDKVLVIDDVHGLLTAGMEEAGYVVEYRPKTTRSELLELVGGYEGLVVRTKTTIDEEVLKKATRLKFIARAGSGVDNIDTDYCDRHGILYVNAGEANADAVAEQTIGMLLGLLANIVKADDEVRRMTWDREGNRGTELKGKTVGIVGYGNTGKAVAKKLSGFDVKVLAYDRYLQHYSDAYAKEAEMSELFEEADVITFHVPLTDETKGMVNRDYLHSFSKPVILLNLSRGGVVRTADLVEAMMNGKVIAGGLDVLENEKLDTMTSEQKRLFDFLIKSTATVLTPHVGGWTTESYEKISKVLLQKIKELKTNEQRN